jgi:hypothetical protein
MRNFFDWQKKEGRNCILRRTSGMLLEFLGRIYYTEKRLNR